MSVRLSATTCVLSEARISTERNRLFIPFVMDRKSWSNAIVMPSISSASGTLTVHSRLCQYHRATKRALGVQDGGWVSAQVHVGHGHMRIEPAASVSSPAQRSPGLANATFVFHEERLGIRLEFLKHDAADAVGRNGGARCIVQPGSVADSHGVQNGATLIAVDGVLVRELEANEVQRLFKRARPITIEVASQAAPDGASKPTWLASTPALQEPSQCAIGATMRLSSGCSLLLSRVEPRLIGVCLPSDRLLLLHTADAADALRWLGAIGRLLAEVTPSVTPSVTSSITSSITSSVTSSITPSITSSVTSSISASSSRASISASSSSPAIFLRPVRVSDMYICIHTYICSPAIFLRPVRVSNMYICIYTYIGERWPSGGRCPIHTHVHIHIHAHIHR